MEYIELNIILEPRDPWAEILIADLAEHGYESFMETEKGIMAYGRIGDIDVSNPLKDTLLSQKQPEFKYSVESKVIPHENWNAKWEADFQPVVVDDYCTILAPFHDQSKVKGMPVIIQPQMSFGTGHHQTTYMMAKALFELKEMPEKVLDMGTGTGVLAIIAEKLGAGEIIAVDIEDWSVENTVENAERNNCLKIKALHGDIDVVPQIGYALILANINKNVLLTHIPFYSNLMDSNAVLLLSGFFETDAQELIRAAKKVGLNDCGIMTRDEWCCLKFIKN